MPYPDACRNPDPHARSRWRSCSIVDRPPRVVRRVRAHPRQDQAARESGGDLDCNFSLLVQCGENLNSWQGEVFFGLPNPLWGLGGFVAPIAVGVALLAGARFARWFWIAFAIGVAGALAFCIWLMSQSFFSLHTLCPWCMLVWAVTILLFWTVWLHVLSKRSHPGARARAAGLRADVRVGAVHHRRELPRRRAGGPACARLALVRAVSARTRARAPAPRSRASRSRGRDSAAP